MDTTFQSKAFYLFTSQRMIQPNFIASKGKVLNGLAQLKRLLADDMGLGKTVQVIFAIKQLLEKGTFSRAVVIAPTP